MTVMGKEKLENDQKVAGIDDVYRALIAVKEKASNSAFKTLGTGCAVRTGDIFGINWRKKFHLLISSALVGKDTLESRENRGKYIGEFEHGKPRLELEKASNTFFKKEHKDFHFIAIGRGRSGKLGHHVLEISQLERDEVLRGKLVCFVAVVSNEKSATHSFRSHEIAYNSQSQCFETTDELGHDEFPRGAPILNEHQEIVGIISGITDGKKLEICFVSDSKPVIAQPKVEENIVPTLVAEVKSEVEEKTEKPKSNGEIKPPEKPQRSTKINRSQSDRLPNYLGTGKDRDLRHSMRYGNRHGYKVYVAGEEKEPGVQRWKPKGFGAKKHLFEGKEPVKFLGARHIASPVAKERQTKMLFNKPRPKIKSSVSLPCKLNEAAGKMSRSFHGVPGRRFASASNIPQGLYLIKDLPSSIKTKAADILDDPAKGQWWRKIAIHYRIREVEVNDLAFGASRHISGSETKALLQKLSVKNPDLTVSDLVDFLLSEHASHEILNLFWSYTYKGV
ncbi:uncharacterized protein LOC114518859 isoform X2 [Dendronephthya gigantea]|uniref:uncharacterized protein LOC114518859 isoform X2 n=1 Tax=Dendronephthya gigantea TaxID=151771 RepID=UPI00106A3EF0|nr:uncharacterized protein LOC114518859 isoform X2 [Dendronephthya gigantea]